MNKKILPIFISLPLSLYAYNTQNTPPIKNDGYSFAIGTGYWNMRGNSQDIYNQTSNKDRTSYGLVNLTYMYDFKRDSWKDIHYGVGLKMYNVIGEGTSVPIFLAQVSATKYITDKFNISATFGTAIYIFDIGFSLGYNLTKNLDLTLGANYTPSNTSFNHEHDIAAYSTSFGIKYTL